MEDRTHLFTKSFFLDSSISGLKHVIYDTLDKVPCLAEGFMRKEIGSMRIGSPVPA